MLDRVQGSVETVQTGPASGKNSTRTCRCQIFEVSPNGSESQTSTLMCSSRVTATLSIQRRDILLTDYMGVMSSIRTFCYRQAYLQSLMRPPPSLRPDHRLSKGSDRLQSLLSAPKFPGIGLLRLYDSIKASWGIASWVHARRLVVDVRPA